MQLGDYLSGKKISDERFARMVSASLGAVRKWRSGERIPRPDLLRRISEVTNGDVTANDFVAAAPAKSPEAA